MGKITGFLEFERNDRDYQDHYEGLTVGLRTSLPGGKATDAIRWGDLLSGGIGLEVQYDYLWRANSWMYGGWYGGLAIDSFGGRHSSRTDPTTGASVDIRTNRLNMADLEFGGKLRQNFSGAFHVDEHVGVGPAIYMKQKVDILNTGPSGLELIKSSVNYMVDFGISLGAPLSKSTDLGLGISYQINGAPDAGKDYTGMIKFKSQGNVVLALTLDFGF